MVNIVVTSIPNELFNRRLNMIDINKLLKLNNGVIRCIAIDPGSKTLGLAILEYSLVKGTISIISAQTVCSKDIVKPYAELIENLGDRFCRNLAYREFIHSFLIKQHIDFVVCESAYAGKFIQAYQSLTEHVTLLKAAVFTYNRKMTFLMVEPSVIKKSMGVKGNSGDKSLMSKALEARNDIIVCDTIEIYGLDEHSVDACCIGLVTLERIRANMNLNLDN